MDYFRALKHLTRSRVRIAHETLIRQANEQGDYTAPVELMLYGTPIITWRKDGHIELTTGNRFTKLTLRRMNEYLPSGYRVFTHARIWFVRTPAGVYAFEDGMVLLPSGALLSRSDLLRGLDAVDLYNKIQDYARTYAAAAVRGAISRSHDCTCCLGEKTEPFLIDAARDQLLLHVLGGETPPALAYRALKDIRNSTRAFWGNNPSGGITRHFLEDVLDASWTEAQKFWRRPKTRKGLIAQTELRLTTPNPPRFDIYPRRFQKNIQLLIEDFLLESLYFERQP